MNVSCYSVYNTLEGPRFVALKLDKSERSVAKTVSKLFLKSADYIQEMFQFPTVDQVSFSIKNTAASLEKHSIAAVNAVNKADSDVAHLKIVLAHLFALMVLTSILSLWDMVFFTIFISMTAPVIYSKHHDKIDPVIAKAKLKAEPYVEKAKVKGIELYTKAKAKSEEAASAVAAKIKERMAKKEVKTD